MTTLLPPGKSQFSDANGAPLAGGSVFFYIPGTTTFKNTWQDPSQLALNTNPVILDASGEAVIYGVGAYRTILKDSLGNQIWDQLTASTDTGGVYSGGTSTGTATDQIVLSPSPAGFSLTAGNLITFIAGFTNPGPMTLNANGTGAKPVLKLGSAGPVALVGGEVVLNNAVALFYDGTQFQLLSNQAPSGPAAWTPTDASGAGLTFTGVLGKYTKIGNMIFAYATFTYPATANGASARISLPVAAASTYGTVGYLTTVGNTMITVLAGLAAADFRAVSTGGGLTNANISGGVFNVTLTYPAS